MPAVAARRGVVDRQVRHGLAGGSVGLSGFEDHGEDDAGQEGGRQGIQRPSGAVEELVIDGPVAVGELADGAKHAGDGGGSATEHPAEGDLPPHMGRGLGEDATKLKDEGIPCRYQKCRIHADLLCDGLDTYHIG